VTIFDRTVADQVVKSIPNCQVISMADAAVGSILGPCFDPDLTALHRDGDLLGIRAGGAEPAVVALDHRPRGLASRVARRLRAQLRPHDRWSRMLLWSLGGLLALVAGETVVGLTAGHEPFVGALYGAVKTITTVGPGAALEEGPGWVQLYGALSMATALVLTAIFTAVLVNRLLSRRLTGILGSRTVPRSDHVIVVGLGQVGLRLCLELRALGIEVVAVEQDPAAAHVPIARSLSVPILIRRAGDRQVLERLSLRSARALAAVTSDERENIAVSVAALAVAPGVRTVLRAGSNEVTRETQALFPIGVAQDMQRIAATALAASALGRDVVQAFVHGGDTYVHLRGGAIERFPPAQAAWDHGAMPR
jgi:hypothetical protein